MRILLIVAALVAGSAFAHGQEANPPALDIEQLSGWFRYEGTDWGCSDTEDNQYRAALGRYSVSNGEFTFGSGKLGFSFYDGGCEFFDPVTRDGKIEMVAICGAEGAHFNGRATLERTGPDRLSIHSPVMDTTLIACPADVPQNDADTSPVDRTLEQFGLVADAAKPPLSDGKQAQLEQFSQPLTATEQASAAPATALSAEELEQLQSLFGSTPRFPSVPLGTHGTEFRGVALGQSRAEVEAALQANGFRCLTPDELSLIDFRIEVVQGYETCRIAPATAGDLVVRALAELAQYEMRILMPAYAVSFIDGRAAALSLPTDYFNATSSTPIAFAQSIAEHYPLPDGLQPIKSGWQGLTSNGELVTIYRIPTLGREVAVMIIVAATSSNTPTFD